jgi:hypothetical protein
MAGWRRAIDLAMNSPEVQALEAISRSRSEPASRVERARKCLSFSATGRAVGGAPSDRPAPAHCGTGGAQ